VSDETREAAGSEHGCLLLVHVGRAHRARGDEGLAGDFVEGERRSVGEPMILGDERHRALLQKGLDLQAAAVHDPLGHGDVERLICRESA
jgi:hypothetical protein